MKVTKKNSMYIILFLLLTCFFISCSKDEGDVTDTYANELRAKLIGTWIDGEGREQYVLESSGTAVRTLFGNGWGEDWSGFFKWKVEKWYGRYEVVFEDIREGYSGFCLEIEFLSYDELKLDGTLFYRKK